ncbi:hypothetical protein B0H17DRAFT_1069043 [Mycena rosella]|uniref:HD domain-containing protein n=1 Tax=Mycena rosella TaxID=1033263 RepID=A0AAD7GHE8_MYCRO|nr:hypothetical protein B0H17DRAFT_1069043 [Mycena rosella]
MILRWRLGLLVALANTILPTPDLVVVELAALLHDVLDKKYVSAEQAADHYVFFLPFFTSMVEKHQLDLSADGRARQVAQIVDNVSWTTETKLHKNNAWSEWHQNYAEPHCVRDADRLDAIGPFGITRCAAYSAAVNRLDNISSTSTAPGKVLGEKRHRVILDFIASIEDEYGCVVPRP